MAISPRYWTSRCLKKKKNRPGTRCFYSPFPIAGKGVFFFWAKEGNRSL